MNKILHRYLIFFAAIIFSCKSPVYQVKNIEKSHVALDSLVVPDEEVLKEIEPYKKSLEGEMNTFLIVSEASAEKGDIESTLGNLVSDIVLVKSKEYMKEKNIIPDLVLLNKGGLRASLPKGNIKVQNVYELMPFENEIVVLEISPEKTKQLLNYVARSHGMPMAGIKMGINDSAAIDVFIGGNKLDGSKNYFVATSDYLSQGGDKMRFFNNPVNKFATGKKMRDALIEYMAEEGKKGNKLKPTKDGRIYEVK